MLALQAVPQTGTPRFPSCSRTSGALGASREGLGNTVPGTQVALACHMGRREQVWGLEAFVPAPASSPVFMATAASAMQPGSRPPVERSEGCVRPCGGTAPSSHFLPQGP